MTSTSAVESAASATPASLMNGSLKGLENGSGSGAGGGQAGTITPTTVEINGSLNGIQSTSSTPTRGRADSMTPNGTNGGAVRRIEVENMMLEFQKNLGPNWDRYRDVVTHFLIGKLSRTELQEELDKILDKSMIRMHNRFLMANLANALRDGSQTDSGNGILSGWAKKSKDGTTRNVKGDSQLAKIKDDIMGLSVRERKRIKAVAKESSKRTPLPSTVTATRQAMLPKIPFVSDKEKEAQQASGQEPKTKSVAAAASQVPTPGNPAAWTQEIIHGYDAPMASEAYELPDNDTLGARMLGISLEHGLLQGIDKNCSEVLLAGLEQYLRDLVQETADRVRLKRRGDSLGTEDFATVLESAATCFVEMSGPVAKIRDIWLRDEDTAPPPPPPPESSASSSANGGVNGKSTDSNGVEPLGRDAGLGNLLSDLLSSY